jgi:hypothetical protein
MIAAAIVTHLINNNKGNMIRIKVEKEPWRCQEGWRRMKGIKESILC